MAQRPAFSVAWDKMAPKFAELARLLNDPKNVKRVQAELQRLAEG